MAKKAGDNMPRYSVSLTPKNIEQIKAIQDELGFASISETVRGCIHAMYSRTFPNYTRTNVAPRTIDVSEPKSNEELLKEKKQKKKDVEKIVAEQQKANELATCIRICEQDLNGEVTVDENDRPVTCVYFQYDRRNRYVQEIDVLSVSKELVESQYLPNRERVEQLQKDGNVDYDVNETVADYLDKTEEKS